MNIRFQFQVKRVVAACGLACISVFTSHAVADNVIHVFLVGGQSNADGRADPSTLPANLQSPQVDIPYYYSTSVKLTTLRPGTSGTSQFGPEVTFGRSMADFYEAHGSSVAILKYAAGGTNLAVQWAAGGDGTENGDGTIYKNFQNTINAGLAALKKADPTDTIEIDGMIWMQGESDAVPAYSAAYQANLKAFIADVRKTYGAELRFDIGELSVNQTGTGDAADRNIVRAAQVADAASIPHTGLVDTDAFPLNSDKLHFSTIGQEDLGDAFAASMETMVVIPEPSTCALFFSGAALLFALSHAKRPKRPLRN